MPLPDYREAAYCGRCHHYGAKMSICAKHGGKVDWLHICATFCTTDEIEGSNTTTPRGEDQCRR